MKKILHIVGARPQFIKLAPVYHALQSATKEVACIQRIANTRQHQDSNMNDDFLKELAVPANAIMHNSVATPGTPTTTTTTYLQNSWVSMRVGRLASMLLYLCEALYNFEPHMVIVYGDTDTTLAGALAARLWGVPHIAHVEAGLRSYNKSMPEEVNRVQADHLSTLLFAPTTAAIENLEAEGLREKAYLVGDVMIDGLHKVFNIQQYRESNIFFRLTLGLPAAIKDCWLLTLHRAYNTDDAKELRSIFKELGKVQAFIIFPAHPRTQKAIEQHGIAPLPSNIHVIPPVGYIDFIYLLNLVNRVVTDSGGVQKEAYTLGTPCITLRPETEWVETVEAGWNILTKCAKTMQEFKPPESSIRPELYPAGASKAIADIIIDTLIK
jgi:UDP-GlcNAc3NAcA epimerase